jgi:glutathione S-transferase
MTQTMRLYDLAGAEPDRRFSPYCWRTRLALAHKNQTVETIPWRFTEKKAIAASGQTLVPVLVDGDQWVSDSWTIANYLEDKYPDSPSLFGGPGGRALPAFRASLSALRLTLKSQPFLAGDRPLYADYAVFGPFQWARCISPFALLENDDPIKQWRNRLLDCFGGLARAMPAYDA